ncbi:Rossmann-fold NAD(P)-binding domain-containing protein [Alkalibacillus haloalkaliphilus]|nr:short-chain dehydrogenase [Alkalibacillus haloalkaliphilus]
MNHVLIVGGTGMLRDATLWVANQARFVSVIGRTEEKMEQVTRDQSNVNAILADYKNEKQLMSKLQEAQKLYGSFDLVVAWVHNIPGKDPLSVIMKSVNNNNEWSLFHVTGSSADLEEIRASLEVPSYCRYSQVQLGFMVDESLNRSRWLTHNEISKGVIDAINKQKDQYIIGQLEPWDQRP